MLLGLKTAPKRGPKTGFAKKKTFKFFSSILGSVFENKVLQKAIFEKVIFKGMHSHAS